ncbi:MAG: hypothetical protein DWQ05_07805 [Calditrichaeota bacterium]|nr:MAG: hypothetical protein DWQ05_07805 [Calditrichota bacterium]
MKYKLSFIAMTFLAIMFACEQNEPVQKQGANTSGPQQVTVEEVIQAKSYTYLQVKSPAASYWLACAKTEVSKGEVIYHTQGLEMRDFRSKELDRTFDKIYFIQSISRQPQAANPGMVMNSPQPGNKMQMQSSAAVGTVEGEISLSELFGDMKKYENKRVTVSGEVTKFLPEIMGKNFLHIQTKGDDGKNLDLSITTADKVNVGANVTFAGKITLNKDFGAGYFYEIIMEDAQLQSGN